MKRLVFHNNRMIFIRYDITETRPFIEYNPIELILKLATGDSIAREKAERELILRN